MAAAQAAEIDGLIDSAAAVDGHGERLQFIPTNGGRMQDYWGVGKATKTDAAVRKISPPMVQHQRDAAAALIG